MGNKHAVRKMASLLNTGLFLLHVLLDLFSTMMTDIFFFST